MARWLHKVRTYQNSLEYSSNVHPGTAEEFEGAERLMGRTRNERAKNSKSLEEWLDWQCEGGWELFKFHPNGWCVFRKQI